MILNKIIGIRLSSSEGVSSKDLFWNSVAALVRPGSAVTVEQVSAILNGGDHTAYLSTINRHEDTTQQFSAGISRYALQTLREVLQGNKISGTPDSGRNVFDAMRYKTFDKETEIVSELFIVQVEALKTTPVHEAKELLKKVMLTMLTKFQGKVDEGRKDSESIRDALLLMPEMVTVLTRFGHVLQDVIQEVFQETGKNKPSLMVLYARSVEAERGIFEEDCPSQSDRDKAALVKTLLPKAYQLSLTYKPESDEPNLSSDADAQYLAEKNMEKILNKIMGNKKEWLDSFQKHTGFIYNNPFSSSQRENILRDYGIFPTRRNRDYLGLAANLVRQDRLDRLNAMVDSYKREGVAYTPSTILQKCGLSDSAYEYCVTKR